MGVVVVVVSLKTKQLTTRIVNISLAHQYLVSVTVCGVHVL